MAGRPFDVVTFDCYGTLIDWEAGIRAAFADEAKRSGAAVDLDRAIAAYHEVEPEVQAGPFRPYRDVLAEVARRVGPRVGLSVGEDRAGFLAGSLPDWPPFGDTADALERLAGMGYRLGILSNVDDDLLLGTRRRLPDVFDPGLIVTAQRVGSYKPARGHFDAARATIGDRRWLHAAQSLFHDIRPADALGLPNAWVNRGGAARPADAPTPGIEVPTLAALAGAIDGISLERFVKPS